MSDKKQQRGLGRGLSALMADVGLNEPSGNEASRRPDMKISVDLIEPNPDQPRRHFEQSALEELADSLRAKGVIQPLILRKHPKKDGRYEIVAGERRWRAAQLAKLHDVPAVIRELDDTEVLEVAIIENIQRAELNPLEEALGYRQLMDRFGHTQERVAEALSKSRSHIANLLRLLNLPEDLQDMLRDGRLTAGHARALLTADDPKGLANAVIAKGLSVREVERLAKKTSETKPQKPRVTQEKDADTRALEADLSAAIGMPVVIDHQADGRGRISLTYKDLDQLDLICQALSAAR